MTPSPLAGRHAMSGTWDSIDAQMDALALVQASRRAVFVGDKVPGYNLDRIDVAAGLRELDACGRADASPETRFVVQYALQRWGKGEEAAAQRGAIDKSFHGIDLMSWYRVLAAAMASAELAAANRADERRAGLDSSPRGTP